MVWREVVGGCVWVGVSYLGGCERSVWCAAVGCALVIIMRECGGGVCMLAVCLVILSVVIYGEGL